MNLYPVTRLPLNFSLRSKRFLARSSILGDPGADSGGEGSSKRAGKYGTFRLSLAPTICPWVSEDVVRRERWDESSFTLVLSISVVFGLFLAVRLLF